MNAFVKASLKNLAQIKRAWLLFAGLAVLTISVYWPELRGAYIFDDGIYFVDNTDVHVTTLHLGDWIKAALSQTGTNQFRALSMWSFAANYYFTGIDPFWPKLTNLAIHLLNGLLLFLALQQLFQLRDAIHPKNEMSANSSIILAATIAGVWLVLPINFTGVAYVAQRMEALANLFVFLGLFLYARTRRKQYENSGGSTASLIAGLIITTLLGFSAKESAVLLPLYAACIELALTGFRNSNGKYDRGILTLYVAILLLPFIGGLIWLAGWIQHTAVSVRTFSIGQRLLTEPRVIVDYIKWILAPNLNELTFYHDDLVASQGLLSPPTTLFSIIALAALLSTALWQRSRRPLFCLGILWFFAGHLLTGTIIPLELVFEHRNYFPSMGLLLAFGSLLSAEPVSTRLYRLSSLFAGAFIALCAFTTLLRAEEWSHPLRLAYSEALKRPDSPRAQYELARSLIIAAGDNEKSPLVDQSINILERNASSTQSGISSLQALIYIAAHNHRDIDPQWWKTIIDRLRTHPPSESDISSVTFLFHCQLRKECPEQKQELLETFIAALNSSNGNVHLVSAYADFAYMELDDPTLAEQQYRDAVSQKPDVATYRANLTRFLIVTRQFEAAEKEIGDMHRLNRFGSLDSTIAALKTELNDVQKAQ